MQIATYLWTYLAVCVLAAASLLIAQLRLPGALAVALIVAGLKALLVLGFFMHLARERFSVKLVVVIAGLMVAILVTLTAADPLSRSPYPPAPDQNAQYGRPTVPHPEP